MHRSSPKPNGTLHGLPTPTAPVSKPDSVQTGHGYHASVAKKPVDFVPTRHLLAAEQYEIARGYGMTMPNFFIIGPARCATDALYSYLKQHPDIYMSPIKETNFFVFYGRPIEYCGPGDQQALQSCYVPNFEAYQAQFSSVTKEQAIGEASPWYIYFPEVPSRIRHHVPNAKLIAMLRNPVDRAYSAFCMMQRDCREPISDFVTAIDLESNRISANWEPIWHYKSMGMYYKQLIRYYETFDRSQIKIYTYDEFDAHPEPIMKDMFRFLAVDDGFLPDMSSRPNQSYVPKVRQLNSFFGRTGVVKSAIKPVLPYRIRQKIRAPLMSSNLSKRSLSKEVWNMMLDFYRSDIIELQDLIERDLSLWLVAR